jgi:hypothetical protein
MSFAIIEKVLVQNGLYWAPAVIPDGRGDLTFEAPVAVRCRWDGGNEERIDAKGVRFLTTAAIMINMDVIPGGVLFLGTLDDFNAAGGDPMYPLASVGTGRIRSFTKIPTLKADKYVRTAYL